MSNKSKSLPSRFLNIKTSIDRIEAIDELSHYHRFHEDFSENWIQKLSLLPPNESLCESLPHLIDFESNIQKLFSPKYPIILLGNYGTGKSLVANKLTSLFSQSNYSTQIYFLAYPNEKKSENMNLNPSTISIASIEDLLETFTESSKDYKIVDTFGLNPYKGFPLWVEDLLKYSARLNFFWIQSSGVDCNESLSLFDRIQAFSFSGIIMTKLDTTVYNGACLTLPYYLNTPLTFYSDSCSIDDSLEPLTPTKLMIFLNRRH